MMVPTLHYFSTQLTHTWRYLYCETSFCMRLLKKVVAKTFSASRAQCLLFRGHSSDSGRSKNLEVVKQVIIIWCKVATIWGIHENLPLELLACSLCSSCTTVLPSLTNLHHFLILPLFIAPSPHTSSMPVNFCQMNTVSA